MNFQIFKESLKKLGVEIDETKEIIVYDIFSNKVLGINEVKLEELYNKYYKNDFSEKLIIYTENSCEVLVNNLNIYELKRESGNQEISIKDEINKINYYLGMPSIEYILNLIVSLIKKIGNEPKKLEKLRDFIYINGKLTREKNSEERKTFKEKNFEEKFRDVFSEIFLKNKIGLQIKTEKKLSFSELEKLLTSFSFEYMYLKNNALIIGEDIYKIFSINNEVKDVKKTQDKGPSRIYTKKLVDFYRRALYSYDPYVQYISYYHILEYNYDEIFKKNVIADLKNKLTAVGFSYKKDEKIYELFKVIKKRLRDNRNSGQGNENDSLKLVLLEYITIKEIISRISELDNNAIDRYSTKEVSFSKGSKINWNDPREALSGIQKRIYKTRNSLIHSKSENKEVYSPYKDEDELKQEIPLIRAIAELIIKKTSIEL